MPWNPNEPLTSWNHPPCPACDNEAEGVTCQCFMGPDAEDDHERIVELSRSLLSESCDRRMYQDLHSRWRSIAMQLENELIEQKKKREKLSQIVTELHKRIEAAIVSLDPK